jgi:hypothetical protein
MTNPEPATLLAQLDACQARLAVLAAHATESQQDELTAVRDQLAAIEAGLRSFADSAHRHAPPRARCAICSRWPAPTSPAELRDDSTPAQHLDRIVRLAQGLVPGTDHAGVSSLHRQFIETLAATSCIPAETDKVQSVLGEGPTFHAHAMHEVVRIDDARCEVRWPRYAARLQEFGLRSLLVCEVPMIRTAPSVLSPYARRRRAFSTAAELVLLLFAARAAVALAHAGEVSNLHKAIDSRQVIGEAVGILMERHRLSADEAFARLVGASQHRHAKLRDLAVRMAETGQEPEDVTL